MSLWPPRSAAQAHSPSCVFDICTTLWQYHFVVIGRLVKMPTRKRATAPKDRGAGIAAAKSHGRRRIRPPALLAGQEPARARRAPRPLPEGGRELRAGLAQRARPRRAHAVLPPVQAERGRIEAEEPCWEAKGCPEELRSKCVAYVAKEGRFCWFFTGRLCAARRAEADGGCYTCDVFTRMLSGRRGRISRCQ